MKCPECKKDLGKATEVNAYQQGWCCTDCDIKIYKTINVSKLNTVMKNFYNAKKRNTKEIRKIAILIYKEKFGDKLDGLPVEHYNYNTILKAMGYDTKLRCKK